MKIIEHFMKRPLAFIVTGIVFTWMLQLVLAVFAISFGMYVIDGPFPLRDEFFTPILVYGVFYLALLFPSLMISGVSHVMAMKYSRRCIYLECLQPVLIAGLYNIVLARGMSLMFGAVLVVISFVNVGIGHWFMIWIIKRRRQKEDPIPSGSG